MIRVLIADDHAIVRRGLIQILSETCDIEVCGEARYGQEVLNKVDRNRYDVVVLDISMPGRSGIEILKQLKAEHPKLPILILSIYPEEQYAIRALKAGASGYLTKESAPDELIEAVRKVASGGRYVTSSLAERLASVVAVSSEESFHGTLSDREWEVFLAIAMGKSLRQIADALCLSVKTISTYRSRILEKMRMQTNAEIIRYAIRNRLVD